MAGLSGALVVLLVCFYPGAIVASSFDDYYSGKDLAKFEEALHRVAKEKMSLEEKVNELKGRKLQLDDAFQDIFGGQVVDVATRNSNQRSRITAISDRIKSMLHRLGDLEGRVAQGAAVAKLNRERLMPTWSLIHAVSAGTTITQNGDLDEINATLSVVNEKVNVKLLNNFGERLDTFNALQENIDNLVLKVNSRKCFVNNTEVMLDPLTADGSANVTFPPLFFAAGVPTALCGIQGVVSALNPDKTEKYDGDYGYGSYRGREDQTHAALTVDCESFNDRVEVKVFDQSRSRHGNSQVNSVNVEVTACSFPAL